MPIKPYFLSQFRHHRLQLQNAIALSSYLVCDGKVSADRTFYNYSPRPKFILTPNPLQASINIDNKYQAIQSFGQPKKL